MSNDFTFWTPWTPKLSFLPTYFAYSCLFDDGERTGAEMGKFYIENFWLADLNPIIKPVAYLFSAIVVLLTVPVSLFIFALALPIALIHDAKTALSSLMCDTNNIENTPSLS
ncbi:MAG: hypothetical protein H0U73_11115 [Tatlockia sp.]|nr:hypothetical protein [Tatlockia sp.]